MTKVTTKAFVTKSASSLMETAKAVVLSNVTLNLPSAIRRNPHLMQHTAFDYLSGFTVSGTEAITRDLIALGATGKHDPNRLRTALVTANIGLKPVTLVEWQEDGDPIITETPASTFNIYFTVGMAIIKEVDTNEGDDDKYYLDVDAHSFKVQDTDNEVIGTVYEEVAEEFIDLYKHNLENAVKFFTGQDIVHSNNII